MRRAHYRNAQRTFSRLLALGVVPVVNENDTVATDEIRFGDNDRLAALVAHLVGADALVLLSDVDALYDGDPRLGTPPKITEVDDASDVDGVVGWRGGSGLGTGGMASKLAAARLAAAAGIPVLLAAAAQAGGALGAADVGTAFAATGSRLSARRFWLGYAADASGRLHLDAGAVAAVVRPQQVPAGRRHHRRRRRLRSRRRGRTARPGGPVVARGVVAYDAPRDARP